MSSAHAVVAFVGDVKHLENSDRLDTAVVLGYQVVVGRDTLKEGDLIVYIPPDHVVPVELSDKLGVTQYLDKGRVKAIKLRGEKSFGLVVQLSQLGLEMTDVVVGVNLAEQIGVTKWEPPTRGSSGVAGMGNTRSVTDWPNFFKYTDLEHLRLYPESLNGKVVVATEKIHGMNSRVGRIFNPDSDEFEFVAGSRKLQRMSPAPRTRELPRTFWQKLFRRPATVVPLEDLGVTYRNDSFWFPLSIGPVRQMLDELSNIYGDVILYGEIYGKGVQTMEYGEEALAYRAFDLSINGQYVPYAMLKAYCSWYGVDMAPEVFVGPYMFDVLQKLAEGDTIVGNAVHIREGLVVRPFAEELVDPRVGRQIFKLVSDAYLLGKKSDFTEV